MKLIQKLYHPKSIVYHPKSIVYRPKSICIIRRADCNALQKKIAQYLLERFGLYVRENNTNNTSFSKTDVCIHFSQN